MHVVHTHWEVPIYLCIHVYMHMGIICMFIYMLMC